MKAPDTSQATPSTPTQPTGRAVDGFRSAKFGMTEDQVRSAIEADFHASGDAIQASENPAELTRVLTVRATDLLEGGGAARVSYIFGYKTKKLIQVSVTWSKATDDTVTPERLYSNANILRK
ncbi:MAG: hypothetical protein ACJ8AW_55135 [Rhodopila sp.]